MDKNLKLTMDVSAVPNQPAGAGRYILDLVSSLSKIDQLQMTLISRSQDIKRWERIDNSNVVASAPKSRPFRLLWEQLYLPSVIAKANPQVHHSPHYTMPIKSKVPTVVTIHDLTFFSHPEWHEKTKVALFKRSINTAVKNADAIICVSNFTANCLESIVPGAKKVFVIPHGVEHDKFNPFESKDNPDDQILSDFGIKNRFILFVGTIEPRKDVVGLVKAFDKIGGIYPDLKLVLAGVGGWGLSQVQEAISKAKYKEKIILTGYVPSKVLPALMRKASAMVYPSFEEGFGLPALEAMACGSPLITTKGSAMEEVSGGAAILITPGDNEALAEALRQVIDKDNELEARRLLGLELAKNYTWNRAAVQHLKVYKELAYGTQIEDGVTT